MDGHAHGAGPGALLAARARGLQAPYAEQPPGGQGREQGAQGAEVTAEGSLHEEGEDEYPQQQAEADGGDGFVHDGQVPREQGAEHAPGAEGAVHGELQHPDQQHHGQEHAVLYVFKQLVRLLRHPAHLGDQLFPGEGQQLLQGAEGAQVPAEEPAPEDGHAQDHSQGNEAPGERRQGEGARDQGYDHVLEGVEHGQKQAGEQQEGQQLDAVAQQLGRIGFPPKGGGFVQYGLHDDLLSMRRSSERRRYWSYCTDEIGASSPW